MVNVDWSYLIGLMLTDFLFLLVYSRSYFTWLDMTSNIKSLLNLYISTALCGGLLVKIDSPIRSNVIDYIDTQVM